MVWSTTMTSHILCACWSEPTCRVITILVFSPLQLNYFFFFLACRKHGRMWKIPNWNHNRMPISYRLCGHVRSFSFIVHCTWHWASFHHAQRWNRYWTRYSWRGWNIKDQSEGIRHSEVYEVCIFVHRISWSCILFLTAETNKRDSWNNELQTDRSASFD